MLVTFLGTGSAVPSRTRNLTSIALSFDQRGDFWLFDCGEGTQHQIQRSALRLGQLGRIFITHLHGDHVFGLFGLLCTLSANAFPEGLDLYGPPGLEDLVLGTLSGAGGHLPIPMRFHAVRPGLVWEDDDYRVTCAPLLHVIPTFGYRVEELARPGRLDVERARALGVPDGPLLGRLKSGEDVTLDNGRVVPASGLTATPRPGRVFALCLDTAPCDGSLELAKEADLLVHEATYGSADAALAPDRLHSTPTQAAEVARQAGARRLAITHFSPRYQDAEPLAEEARRLFPETFPAEDLMVVRIPIRQD
jgi:ribonuclease Z